MSRGSSLSNVTKPPRIIAGAMIMSVFTYVAVAWVLMNNGWKAAGEGLEMMRYILGAIGLAMIPLSFLMRSLLLNPERLPAPKEGEPAEPGEPSAAIRNAFVSAHIVALALCESIAIYGLIIFFVLGDFWFFVGMAAISVMLMLVHFPREDTLTRIMREYELRSQSRGM